MLSNNHSKWNLIQRGNSCRRETAPHTASYTQAYRGKMEMIKLDDSWCSSQAPMSFLAHNIIDACEILNWNAVSATVALEL